jgi:hypothetical protein
MLEDLRKQVVGKTAQHDDGDDPSALGNCLTDGDCGTETTKISKGSRGSDVYINISNSTCIRFRITI